MSETNVRTFNRAQAWKDVALGTRKVCGEVMELLGECSAHLKTLMDKPGWTIRPDYCALAKELVEKIDEVMGRAQVSTPAAIFHELRRIDEESA